MWGHLDSSHEVGARTTPLPGAGMGGNGVTPVTRRAGVTEQGQVTEAGVLKGFRFCENTGIVGKSSVTLFKTPEEVSQRVRQEIQPTPVKPLEV